MPPTDKTLTVTLTADTGPITVALERAGRRVRAIHAKWLRARIRDLRRIRILALVVTGWLALSAFTFDGLAAWVLAATAVVYAAEVVTTHRELRRCRRELRDIEDHR